MRIIISDSTCLTHPDELISISAAGISEGDLTTMTGLNISLGSDWNAQDPGNYEDDHSCDFSNLLSSFNFSVATSVTSLDSINSMQSIFELDADCNVILQGRIGQVIFDHKQYIEIREYVISLLAGTVNFVGFLWRSVQGNNGICW